MMKLYQFTYFCNLFNTQDVESEACDENMRKDEKLMEFINTATTALLSTRNSKSTVRVFLKTLFDQLKVFM